jgi:internalin A
MNITSPIETLIAARARAAWIAGALAWIGLGMAQAFAEEEAKPRLFPDPQLEAAVRQQVFAKRGTEEPLVESDVVNVSTVQASGRGITNLAGLEKCRSLAMLEIANNQVSDLGPLAGLERLQFLDAQGNQISDLTPLARTPALQYLHLAGNKVWNVAPLAGLTNLSALYLSGNQVEEIGPLLGLRKLVSLYLDNNKVRSLEGIGRLRSLSSLSLSGNGIADLRPMERGPHLQFLFLENNKIEDLQPLVQWVKSDKERRFAPYLQVYLAGNPLSENSTSQGLAALREVGTRAHVNPASGSGGGGAKASP